MSLTLIPRMSYQRDADVMVPMLQNVNELLDVEDTVLVILRKTVSQNLLESKTLLQNKVRRFGKENLEVVERRKERVGGNGDICSLLVRKSH